MKTSMTLTFTPLFLSVMAAHMSDPRPLAPPGDETVNTLPSIDDPLTRKTTTLMTQVLRCVPKGLNKDKGWKDALLMAENKGNNFHCFSIVSFY